MLTRDMMMIIERTRTMRRSAFAFIFIVLWTLCFESFAGKEDIHLAAQKAARIALAAVMKIKNEETQGICRKAILSLKKMCAEKPLEALKGITAVIGGVFSAGGAWYALSNSRAGNKEVIQEKALANARQELIELLDKNSNEEIGVYGLPKACDGAIKKLIFLPGGREELKKIIDVFQEYFVDINQKSKGRERNLSDQEVNTRSSLVSRLLFWKKAASETK
jgi:hypothetical protein